MSLAQIVTQDEVHDTLARIVTAPSFTNVQDVRHGYDKGRIVVFVKADGFWYRLHTDPPNASIIAGLKARSIT
ncbi:MAG TPA: hypothetical protein VMV59_08875 [Candidatus Dormibacteraeota bacterium]|nr:hypothetical protein [Candidatus Dormibacteraeota bacterium]